MKERNLKREIIAFLGAASVLCAGSVYAADTPTVSDLDEVVVSATKTKQTVYEAPAAVSVVTAADIVNAMCAPLPKLSACFPVYSTRARRACPM